MALIYCIKNRINDKKYIGYTSRRFEKRLLEHFSDAFGSKNSQFPIHVAIRKYGKENFDCFIVYEGENALELEDGFIRLMGDYNIAEGGGIIPDNKGRKFTEEHKKKLSLAKLGKASPNKGRQVSEEVKKKISETLKRKGIKPPSRLGVKQVKILT